MVQGVKCKFLDSVYWILLYFFSSIFKYCHRFISLIFLAVDVSSDKTFSTKSITKHLGIFGVWIIKWSIISCKCSLTLATRGRFWFLTPANLGCPFYSRCLSKSNLSDRLQYFCCAYKVQTETSMSLFNNVFLLFTLCFSKRLILISSDSPTWASALCSSSWVTLGPLAASLIKSFISLDCRPCPSWTFSCDLFSLILCFVIYLHYLNHSKEGLL